MADKTIGFLIGAKKIDMKRENVESSVLKSVGYDKNKKVLETELVNQALYEYYKVPVSEYANLMNSPSLGEYYNKHIKKYCYKKLR